MAPDRILSPLGSRLRPRARDPLPVHRAMSRCPLPTMVAAYSNCGDEGIRTPDLLRAREALSHLSYVPLTQWAFLDLNQRPFPYQRNALAN